MKFTLIFLVVFIFQSRASTFAQKVSLNLQNATLTEVIAQISEQTKIAILYNNGSINDVKPISIRVKQKDLIQVLDECFKNQPLTYKVINNVILITEKPKPQITEQKVAAVVVTGKVTNENGDPLPGVSVNVKNSSVTSVTDIKGLFTISADVNAVLQFTYIGYEPKEVTVTDPPKNINISLAIEVNKLNEVVVQGYGGLKRRDITGSSSGVSAKVIGETPATTLENALQGRMAGVNITNTSAEPGGGIDIQVRGITSISGGNQPLYVIDGVPQYNDNTRSAAESNGNVPTNFLATLNPSDIESVEVLKDASSASIYGSRGANGVILITTKKGKSGKPTIDFNYYETMAERPKEIPLANAQQFATFINLTNTNDGQKPYYDGTYKLTNNGQDSVYFPSPSQLGTGTDWQHEIYRNALTENAQLTMSGGNDAVRYLISGNYLQDEGVVKDSKYIKGSLRANVDAKITNNFSANLTFNVARDLNNRAENSNLSTTPGGLSPSGVILKSFLASPVLGPDDDKYGASLLLSDRGSSSGLINPLHDLEYAINQRTSSYEQTTLDLVYKFTDYLNLTVRGAYNNTASNNDQYWGLQTEQGYDNGQQTFQSTWNTASYINEDFLTFNKAIGKFHSNVVVGVSGERDNSRGTVLSANELPIPTDNGLYLLGLYKNINIPITNEIQSTLLSAFGRASFDYDNKYLLTLSARDDGSSKFAINKKWAFFPSIGLGWNFIQEDFLKGAANILSNGKIRGSFGTSGNQAITAYQSLASLSPISYGFYNGAATGVITNTSQNDNLTWETTKQIDLGLDLGFLHDRFRFTFDLYRKTTDNLLQQKNIPSESGYTSILANFGSIRNQGAEIELGATLIKHDAFSWNSNFNISANRNKILYLGPGIDYYNETSGQADYTHRLTVGGSIGEFWGYKTAGLLTAQDITNKYPGLGGSTGVGDLKFVDQDHNGIINDADKVGLGNALPNFTAGLSNDFTYHNWSLNIFLNGVFGNQILDQNLLYSAYGSYFGVPTQKYLANYWTPQNLNAYYPKPSAAAVNNVTSDRLIESGTYVRIKTVTLRYNLTHIPTWARKIQFYVTANNLYTFTKYDGYDPEVSAYGQNVLTPGIDVGSYPRTRMWTAGIDLGL